MDQLTGIWLSVLANSVWQGAIAALLGALALRLLAQRSASTRHAVLWTLLAAAALVPVVSAIASRPAFDVASFPSDGEVAARSALQPAVTALPVRTVEPAPAIRISKPDAVAPVHVAGWLALAYGAVVAALLVRIAIALSRLRRLKQSAVPLPTDVEMAMRSVANAHRARRRVRFGTSTELSSPAFAGMIQPLLLFPAHEGASRDELMLAASHELAHAERYDDWWSFAEHVLVAVLFFNPAVLWLVRQIRLEREIACDEWVVSRTKVSARAYIDALLAIADRASVNRLRTPFAQAMTGSSLRARVDRLLARRSLPRVEARRANSALLASIVAVTVFAGVTAPSLTIGVASANTGALSASARPDLRVAAARLDSFADLLERSGRSGAILAAVGEDIVVHRGFGVRDRATRDPVTTSTRFNMGALAKMLTAAAILQLERDGKLSTRDLVSRWIGELPAPKNAATIEHVLVHTAGLTAFASPVFAADRGRFIEGVRTVASDFAPGMGRRYTDIGYSVLAVIVELASGMRYEEYVRRHLLEPAGMRSTTFESEMNVGSRAVEYRDPANARSVIGDRAYVWGRRGGMGVVSTVEDLYRWHRAIENGLIRPEQRARLYGVDRDAGRNVMVGYGWETASTDRGTIVQRFLSGWPGNSVELMHEPSTGTTIAFVFDSRVDWDRPRYNEISRVLQGEAPEPAAKRAVASTPGF